MKVFVTRAIAEKALARVRQAAETEVWPEDRAIPREVLLEKVRGMAGLLCLLTDPIDGTLMDAAGVSLAVVSGDRAENEYQEYRGYATYSPAKWRFALDALTHQYEQAIDGTEDAYHVVASAGYQLLEILQLSGDLTYTKSPRFDEDYAGLLRVSLLYGISTGGKQ